MLMQTMDEYTPDIPEEGMQPTADPRAAPQPRLPMKLPVPPFAFEAWDTKADSKPLLGHPFCLTWARF